jgi:protein CpxP
MKKMLLLCGLLLGISAASFAQGGMRRSPAEQAKNMQTQLKLTDDQTAKITAILQTQSTKMDSIRTAANGDRDAMRSAMGPIRQDATAKIGAILTADQKAAYQKMMEEQRARMQQGQGGGAPPSQR